MYRRFSWSLEKPLAADNVMFLYGSCQNLVTLDIMWDSQQVYCIHVLMSATKVVSVNKSAVTDTTNGLPCNAIDCLNHVAATGPNCIGNQL